ncbi:MAG: hypothetical protein Roseis2KO_51130 [Roseivirga sp.]
MVSEFTDNDFRNRSLEEIEIDSFYSEASVIVQFLPQNKFILTPLFEEKRTGTYFQKQDTIFAKTDSTNWYFSVKNEELVLLDLDSGWQSTRILFERLSPAGLNNNFKIKDRINEHTYWRLSVDSSSRYFASSLYFYSTDSIVIEKRFSDSYGSTGVGRYNLDFFEGHTFISYYDRQRLDFYIIHLIAKSGNTLIGQTSEVYENPFSYNTNDLTLEPISKPVKTDLSAIRKLLIGTWESSKDVFPSDTLLTRYDSITDQYYKLTFSENGKFSLNYGGNVVNGENVKSEIKTYAGNWSLGVTGKFIKLKLDDGDIFFLSILSLNKDSISYTLDFDTLGEEGFYFGNYLIKLSKR